MGLCGGNVAVPSLQVSCVRFILKAFCTFFMNFGEHFFYEEHFGILPSNDCILVFIILGQSAVGFDIIPCSNVTGTLLGTSHGCIRAV